MKSVLTGSYTENGMKTKLLPDCQVGCHFEEVRRETFYLQLAARIDRKDFLRLVEMTAATTPLKSSGFKLISV
jgi:hypothetical protein